MDEKAIEARRAYKRAWYKAHPGKQQEYEERYWLKKAEQMAAAVADKTEPTATAGEE